MSFGLDHIHFLYEFYGFIIEEGVEMLELIQVGVGSFSELVLAMGGWGGWGGRLQSFISHYLYLFIFVIYVT